MLEQGSPALLETPDEPEGYTIPHPSQIEKPKPQASRFKKREDDEVTEYLICEVIASEWTTA